MGRKPGEVGRYDLSTDEWLTCLDRVRELSGVTPENDECVTRGSVPGDWETDDHLRFGAWRQAVEELLHRKGPIY